MDVFNMIMALIGVLALVFVVFWLMKKLNAGTYMSSSGHMRVLERIVIGQDKMLLLVSICGKCMVLCVTANHTEKICDLEQTEEELTAKPEGENPSFAEALKITLEKMKNK